MFLENLQGNTYGFEKVVFLNSRKKKPLIEDPNVQCRRFWIFFNEFQPPTIEIVTNEMCAGPLDNLQCELMGKLSLEYTREKIMELRLKSNCLGVQSSSEFATHDEKCAILEELPQQSVKLATVSRYLANDSHFKCLKFLDF
ncbi:hypothetical protein ANCCAN_07514 [Ancylostoma caninum]|uniref:Uncharacterized protein n=1 Tax=Ancylostoma caninum TaxID=29170 RepID=A0A368GPY7_ANCCA|nr:hypothetical protein ANCCAN_07514 [Ancylostoma caninum]